MPDFLQLPPEPSRDELDKLFALAGTPEPGPHDDEFYRVARRVVPGMQRLIASLEHKLTVANQELKHKPRKAP
jgi:hypothetical protein